MKIETMFTMILERFDTMETGINARLDKIEERLDRLEARIGSLETRMDKLEMRMDSLEARMNRLEAKVNKLEADMNMEFQAVRTEMDVLYKTLQKEIDMVNDKVDRLLLMKNVDEYDKINIRLEVLEKGYQELRELIV